MGRQESKDYIHMKCEKELKKPDTRKETEIQNTGWRVPDAGYHRKWLRNVLVQCFPNNSDNNVRCLLSTYHNYEHM